MIRILIFDSLLNGPLVQVLHDEKGDGCFRVICQNQPLYMLSYFSSLIQQETQSNSNNPTWSWTPQYPQQQFQHQHLDHLPVAVRLVGGSPTALRDLIAWMTASCENGAVLTLRTVIACPARYVLAMNAVRRMGISLLVQELPTLIARLRYEIFDVATVAEIFSAGDSLSIELADPICHCVARYFFHGSLLDAEKWLQLASMNLKFDSGVMHWLGVLNEGPGIIGSRELWRSRSIITDPARWYQSPLRRQPSVHRLRPQAHLSPSSVPLHSAPHIPVPHSDRQPAEPPCFVSTTTPHTVNMPAPPSMPAAYHHTYTMQENRGRRGYCGSQYPLRCSHCHQAVPESEGIAHRCTTGHAYTVSNSPSPPQSHQSPRSLSPHSHRPRSYTRHRSRSNMRESPRCRYEQNVSNIAPGDWGTPT